MRRREIVAGFGSIGVLAGATGVAVGKLFLPSFGSDSTTDDGDGGHSDGPVDVETIDARGSEAGTVTVPNDGITVVSFFVTGCGHCQATMPRLAEARSRLVEDGGDELTFLSVTYQSLDNKPADELREWWRAHSGNWNVGYDPNSTLAARYGVYGYPVTVVVDERGEKHWDKLGIIEPADLVEAVESVLESADGNASESADGNVSESAAD
ncbi:TlpA family protein disulfide reductase [Natrinema salaciae]|uniref:Cytochrome oxidase Cu insertion factor, SCO1/SenC/PrrC family n=1 Tax=Natrinema salaciae TaxID=1186196 RepID=A0A1H9GUB4_9EURY|nr:TlpA disulfide reductase family protein [Natrinema salaciae]SEQ53593.1 Cytochrome oxidase Cu insertion factor, SCO1/SenC/PrrC family [Natrinema salaciae]